MKGKILDYIKKWEGMGYSNGLPETAPNELERRFKATSYRRICLAILKNDITLKTLGQTGVYSNYYDYYKSIEISNRLNCKQLKLDL